MAIISFALTEQEFMSGRKTVTRRAWKPAQLKRWQKWWDEGKHVHDGWSKVPFAGGRFLAKFRLTARPYLERLGDMPETDLEAEGGMCKTLAEFRELVGYPPEKEMAVIRFEKLDEGEDRE